MEFLRKASVRPHHAYVFAGPEGSGKSLAARAFAASLLCSSGGCGACRDCRLALGDAHPNVFLVEPEGRDLHVGTIRDEVWHPAYRTAPEAGRKVFVIKEADRLTPEAADTILKVLEEPPVDSIFFLLSARADELPSTIVSRCHFIAFTALAERFVVEALQAGGAPPDRALVAARISGGNLGRARRLAGAQDGLAFRDAAIEALNAAAEGPVGAIRAAEFVLASAADHKKALKAELDADLTPFLNERGKPEESYRSAIRRLELRHQRRERRAERDHVDRVLLAASSLIRDRLAAGLGAEGVAMNPDLGELLLPGGAGSVGALASMEEARASLAEDLNLNTRLVLERAFLGLSS